MITATPSSPAGLPAALVAAVIARLEAVAVLLLADPESSRSFDTVSLVLEIEAGWHHPCVDLWKEATEGGRTWRTSIASGDAHRMAHDLLRPEPLGPRLKRLVPAVGPIRIEGPLLRRPLSSHQLIAARHCLAGAFDPESFS